MSATVPATGSTASGLPWRGPGPGRPTDLPLPPDGRLPLLGPGRRLRKRWRYVGVFCDEFMLCAARAQVGPVGQTFWAIVDRSTGEMIERTRKHPPFGRGDVWSLTADKSIWPIGSDEEGVVTWVDAKEARAKLEVGKGTWVESVNLNGAPGEGGWVWTRKRIAPIVCDVRLPDGRRWKTTAFGVEDESAGYHPRHTVWQWSAGVGHTPDGRALGWNLVSGVNDGETGSERAVWVDGEPFEPGPVSFAPDLGSIGFAEGGRLEFEAEAERHATENLRIVRFEYRQPFGSFSGSLAGIEIASGIGVMEHHDALW
jgi:hypothetical protein